MITDGAPNCGSAGCAPGPGYMTNQCDDANAIAAVKQTYGERGIPTFVVGVGMTTGPAEETLTQLALQGGTALPAFPFYYSVERAGDLSAVLAAIVASAAP